MLVWWNGRRVGLKIRCWRQHVGSSPTTSTTKKQPNLQVAFLFSYAFRHRKFAKITQHSSHFSECLFDFQAVILSIEKVRPTLHNLQKSMRNCSLRWQNSVRTARLTKLFFCNGRTHAPPAYRKFVDAFLRENHGT